jgi:tetratricopeptide (TPR) repeat protein
VIIPLQLRHAADADASATAWFLPGDSAERWLEELARCGLANGETRLFAVPRSLADRSPAGLLVVPAVTHSLRHPPAGVACKLIGGRLFVPVDAILHPPVTDAEVRALCPLPVVFFHPAFGLSGFEEESTLRVWNLIEFPEERGSHWNLARSGVPSLPALNAVVLAQPPSLEDLFGGAEQDIGSEPPVGLPPAPDEPKEDAWAKSRRNLRRLFAKGVAGAMRQIPHTGLRRTWVNDMEEWANRQLHGVNEQLQKIRNKELHRLLHLLDSDPEAGLRHALPLNAFAHRGVAPPGARLGLRSLDFDPRRLGGQAADFWDVPPDMLDVLRLRYREMADREMQLGRHRRAAYIYAELLGDLVSAAHALKQGRHYREAAVIYDEHLHNPLEAARCLADGGLLPEAIERYEKLGRWLEAADLHERMGHQSAAEAAIRRVVNDRLSQDDILGAAKLVEERLHAADEALELLLGGWPSSRQAAGCVSAAFQILARLGRHEAALERLAQFGRESVPNPMPLLNSLGGIARDYPHEQVRQRAADFSRVLVARQLTRLPSSVDGGRLIEFLVRLAPQDRLLARDGNRFLAERRGTELRAQRVTPPPLPRNQPVVHRRIELPRQMQWLHLRRERHWFYAVGITPKRLTLVRGGWEGEIQSLSWDCPVEAVKNGLMFEPTREGGRAVALATLSGTPLAPKRFPATDLFFGQVCVAGRPAWLPSQGFPFAFGEDAAWSGHVAAGRAILSCHDKRGNLQRTIDVTSDLLDEAERNESTRFCLTALTNGAAIALGNRLVVTRKDGGLQRLLLPGQVVGLFATLPHTRQGIAVMLEQGAFLHWIGDSGFTELDRDIASPMGAFVPGGPLVLLSGNRLVLLEVDSRGVQSVTRVKATGRNLVGVSATASPGHFAVLAANGEMTVYRMPR